VKPVRKSRGLILFMLCVATTINYVDRQLIELLTPTLSRDLGWTGADCADIIFVFQATVSYMGMGWVIDWIGVQLGFSIAVFVWSSGRRRAWAGLQRGRICRRPLCAGHRRRRLSSLRHQDRTAVVPLAGAWLRQRCVQRCYYNWGECRRLA